VDPDSLNPDPDPAFQVNPDPVRIQCFDDQKFKKINTAENFFFFFKKTSKLQEKPSAKEHLKKFIKFLVPYTGIKHLFCPWVIIALLDLDLDCESGSRDPIECGSTGSGSTTLIKIEKTGSDWAIKRCGSCPQSNELT
jgi:hypothetical protein